MSLIRQKQESVALLRKSYEASQAVFFINVQGLKVAQIDAVRKGLRQDGGSKVKVTKARAMKRIFNVYGQDADRDPVMAGSLRGQLAMIFSHSDPSEVAKKLMSFQKSAGKQDFVVGGVYADRFLDHGAVKRLAELPPYQVLMAQCASAIAAPLVGVARSLSEITASLARAVKAVSEK